MADIRLPGAQEATASATPAGGTELPMVPRPAPSAPVAPVEAKPDGFDPEEGVTRITIGGERDFITEEGDLGATTQPDEGKLDQGGMTVAPSPDPAGSIDEAWTFSKGLNLPMIQDSIMRGKPETFDRIEDVETGDGKIRTYGIFNGGRASILIKEDYAPLKVPEPAQPEAEAEDWQTTMGRIDETLNAPFGALSRGTVNLVGNVVRTAAETVGADEMAGSVEKFLDMLNQIHAESPTAKVGEVVGDLAGQYVVPAISGAGLLVKAGASPLVASLVTDAMIGYAGIDPKEENLSSMIPEDSEAFGMLRDVMATDPDAPDYQNRLRNLVEAVTTLGFGEAFIRALPKVIEQAQRVNKAVMASGVVAGGVTADSSEAEAGLLSSGIRGASRAVEGAPAAERATGLVRRVEKRGDVTIPPESTATDALKRLDETAAIRADIAENVGNVEDIIGVDFNFDNFHTPDSIKMAINEVSGIYAAEIDAAKRGVISHAATKQMAEQLDMLPEVFNRKVGQLWNAEQMVAARSLLAQSARKLDDLAQKVRSAESSDMDMLNFRKQMALHAAIQMEVKGAQTEIARALSSFRVPVASATGGGDPKLVDELLKQMGGRSNTKDLADAYLALNDPAQRNKFAFGTWGAKVRDAWLSVWINGLLSSPMTHVRNTVGNAMFKAWSIPETVVAGGIGQIRHLASGANTDRVYATEAVAQLFGFVNGFGDALRLAGKAFKSGVPSDAVSKMEAMKHKAISAETFEATGAAGKAIDYLGVAIELPGRFLVSQDEFFKALAGRMENYSLAYRQAQQAVEQGASQQEAVDLMVQQIRNPDPDMVKQVEDAARYYTFTNELGKVGKWVQAGQQFAPVRIVLPFVRTPINILKAFASRNPITAPMMGEFRRDFAAGGARRDMALARVALGSGVMGYAANLAMDDRITGSGPTDRRERAALRQTGWQPYSFFFKKGATDIDDATISAMESAGVPISRTDEGVYVSYAGLEPMGLLFGVAADGVNIMKWQTNEEAKDNIASAMVLSIYENMKDRSFLEGLSQATRAMEEGKGYATSYLQNLANSGAIIPKPYSSLLRKIEAMDDPTKRDRHIDPSEPWAQRQWDTVWNAYIEGTPGLSDKLPPVRNLWGQPVKLGAGNWHEIFNPFYISPKRFTPVENEIIRLDGPIGLPERKMKGVDLNPEEYSRYVELQGTTTIAGSDLKTALGDMIASSDYAQMDDPDRVKILQAIHDDYLKQAARELVDEYPMIGVKIDVREQMIRDGVKP